MPDIKHTYSTKKNWNDTSDVMNVTGKVTERWLWAQDSDKEEGDKVGH